MHIVLGLLGTIVSLAIVLKRLADNGYDLWGMNPFSPRRPRRRAAPGNPIYAIESPMDLAALLMLALLKREGELSAGNKALLLGLYHDGFRLSRRQAAALLASSSQLLGAGDAFIFNLEKVVAPSRAAFTDEQVESTLSLLEQVAAHGGGASERQRTFIDDVRGLLVRDSDAGGKWH